MWSDWAMLGFLYKNLPNGQASGNVIELGTLLLFILTVKGHFAISLVKMSIKHRRGCNLDWNGIKWYVKSTRPRGHMEGLYHYQASPFSERPHHERWPWIFHFETRNVGNNVFTQAYGLGRYKALPVGKMKYRAVWDGGGCAANVRLGKCSMIVKWEFVTQQ